MKAPVVLGLLTREAVDTDVGNSRKSVGNLLNNLWMTYMGVTTRCCVPDSRAALIGEQVHWRRVAPASLGTIALGR
jgi:hypothetical protein